MRTAVLIMQEYIRVASHHALLRGLQTKRAEFHKTKL